MKVIQSIRAEQDLRQIFLEGQNRFGEPAAGQYIVDILGKYDIISAMPFMAPERTEVRPPVRILPFKGHIIIYRLHADAIQIIRIASRFENWQGES